MSDSINITITQSTMGRPTFSFDGGAATYWGTQLLAAVITVFTAGIMYPYGLVLVQRWRCKHSFIDGRALSFEGKAIGLFGNWIKWFFLAVITVGIYAIWIPPRVQKWVWENTTFAR
ncbi:MAG: DUF898 family protein [Agromyces sp.]